MDWTNCLWQTGATIANMAPEYGATCGIFPIDRETIRYLTLTGRDSEQVALVEAYAQSTGMWRGASSEAAEYSEHIHLDLNEVLPSPCRGPGARRTALRSKMPNPHSCGTARSWKKNAM